MDDAFLKKVGINIDLVEEHADDIKLAKLLSQHKQKSNVEILILY